MADHEPGTRPYATRSETSFVEDHGNEPGILQLHEAEGHNLSWPSPRRASINRQSPLLPLLNHMEYDPRSLLHVARVARSSRHSPQTTRRSSHYVTGRNFAIAATNCRKSLGRWARVTVRRRRQEPSGTVGGRIGGAK